MSRAGRAVRRRLSTVRVGSAVAGAVGPRAFARALRVNRAFAARAPDLRDSFTRQMWEEAAAEVGAGFEEIAPTVFRFDRDGVRILVTGQRTPFADPASIAIASNKALSHTLLREAGLPLPRHVIVGRDPTAATALLEDVSSVVVKPAHGGGGRGVTGAVGTREQLRRALAAARMWDDAAVVEERVEGAHYRVLLLDGAVLGVVRRDPPAVMGNGRASIVQLIWAENEKRVHAGTAETQKPMPLDLDCVFTLAAQGLSFDSVLAAGERARVKTASNFGGREAAVTVERLGDEVVAVARAAARAVGVRLAGVDLLTTDPSVPLERSGGVVLEVNPLPGLVHHYNVADRDARPPVGVAVLDALLREAALRLAHGRADAIGPTSRKERA